MFSQCQLIFSELKSCKLKIYKMNNFDLKQPFYRLRQLIFFFSFLCVGITGCNSDKIGSASKSNDNQEVTKVTVSVPSQSARVNPMIYGQMFEDCNDNIIYGGVVGKNGEPRPHVDEMLKPLQIPIMRWPGGTFVHEYHWERGIGPFDKRPVVEVECWGGIENHRFGTDEFLQWCNKMGIESYINFNMANHPEGGTIEEALNWIEYANGSQDTPYGKKRVENGHPEPYGVKYWCIGNENYGSYGINTKESSVEYSSRLQQWASAIREKHNGLQLLAVGHTYDWNQSVLELNGKLIDFLTQHYYVHTSIKNDSIVEPLNSLFAPTKMEAHLIKLSTLLHSINEKLDRKENPITLSVDEWNNRHQVFDGETYKFTRNDLRRQFDVAVTAGTLNAFIRQCATVGMANYIFPVNGHGLMRTIGENDAFCTPVYYIFELYRKMMIGQLLDLSIEGPGVSSSELKLSISGDADEINMENKTLSFIDGAAVLADDGSINIAIVNRSPNSTGVVKFNFPDSYIPEKKWEIIHHDINTYNSTSNRNEITPQEEIITKKRTTFEIPPCGWMLIQLNPKKN